MSWLLLESCKPLMWNLAWVTPTTTCFNYEKSRRADKSLAFQFRMEWYVVLHVAKVNVSLEKLSCFVENVYSSELKL